MRSSDRSIKRQYYWHLFGPPYEEIDQWLDVEDQALIERVRETGTLDTVYGWAEACSPPFQHCEFSIYGGDTWEWMDAHVRDADRTNSAFFRDEQIASRARARVVRKELARLQEEREHKNWKARERYKERKRYWESERLKAHRLQQEQLYRERREQEHKEEYERQSRIRRHTQLSQMAHLVQTLMATPGSVWSVQTLAEALQQPVDFVREVVIYLIENGRVRPRTSP